MSSCKHGGRDVPAKPRKVEQATIRKLAEKCGEPPWVLEVPDLESLPEEATQFVDELCWRGVRYRRAND